MDRVMREVQLLREVELLDGQGYFRLNPLGLSRNNIDDFCDNSRVNQPKIILLVSGQTLCIDWPSETYQDFTNPGTFLVRLFAKI